MEVSHNTAENNFEVFPENMETVETFLRVCTQWRTSFSGLVGLDYTALFKIIELYAINNAVEVFEGVRTMELTILGKANEGK